MYINKEVLIKASSNHIDIEVKSSIELRERDDGDQMGVVYEDGGDECVAAVRRMQAVRY